MGALMAASTGDRVVGFPAALQGALLADKRWRQALLAGIAGLVVASSAASSAASSGATSAATSAATSSANEAPPSPPACPPPIPFEAHPDPAAVPLDRGLLWRVTRDGRTSWLYGTLHLGRPAWTRPGPQVAAALAAVDVLAVELDPGDPDVQRELAASGAAAAASTAAATTATATTPRPLPPALAEGLRAAIARACLPAAALAPLHPMLQAGTLMLLEGRWLGLDPAWSQEALLLAQARQRGLRVVSLERVSQQIAALLPPDEAATPPAVAQALQQLQDGSARRVLATLAAAWEAGDLQRLERYEDWCECVPTAADRDFMRRLNDERNDALAAGIVARHAAGDRVFAAVGALHMTGPRALPALLQAQGFSVDRVPPRLPTGVPPAVLPPVPPPVLPSVRRTMPAAAAQPVYGSVSGPVSQPVSQPVSEPVSEPVSQPVSEPAAAAPVDAEPAQAHTRRLP